MPVSSPSSAPTPWAGTAALAAARPETSFQLVQIRVLWSLFFFFLLQSIFSFTFLAHSWRHGASFVPGKLIVSAALLLLSVLAGVDTRFVLVICGVVVEYIRTYTRTKDDSAKVMGYEETTS